MNCGIYIRKSREDKDKPSYRLTAQRKQLPAYARTQGWTPHIYDDGHASAARGKAEELQQRARLEADIRQGRIDIILVIELSRLSRDDSMLDYLKWVTLCGDHQVKLATPSQILDPNEESHWMMLTIDGSLSSAEMKRMRKRMADGRRQAFLDGKWRGGTPPSPYRHDKSKGGLVVDPVKLEVARRVWDLAEKHGSRIVAEQLGIDQSVVRKLISDDRLLACQALRIDPETGSQIRCDWEPCISADQVARIQSAKSHRLGNSWPSANQNTSLFAGLRLLKCGYCGAPLRTWSHNRLRKDGTRQTYYGCRNKVRHGDASCTKGRLLIQDQLNESVLTNVFGTFSRWADLQGYWRTIHQSEDPQQRLQELAEAERDLRKKKERLVDAVAEGTLASSDIRDKVTQIEGGIRQVAQQRAETLAKEQPEPDWSMLRIPREAWETLPAEGRRRWLSLVLKKVTLYTTYALIEYPFPRDDTGNRTARVHLSPPKGYKSKKETQPPGNKGKKAHRSATQPQARKMDM